MKDSFVSGNFVPDYGDREPATASGEFGAHASGGSHEVLPTLTHTEVARFFRRVREDLEAHDGDWSRAGFQALLVYRFGVWRMTIRTKLLRAPLSVLWRTLFAAVRNFYGIELPFTARVGRRVIFEHQHGIVVHGNTEIGDDCIIRQGVTLGIRRLDRLTEAPVLGRAVNVGAGAKILGKVRIGDHAEIGANSVVLDDVPAYALAVGIPARQVTRKPQLLSGRREAKGRARTVAPGSVRANGAGSTGSNGTVSDAAVSSGPGSTRSNGPASNGPGSTRGPVRTNGMAVR